MRIRKCSVCGVYTLKVKCTSCGSETVLAKPAKFSPEDPYGSYRRMMKRETHEVLHKDGCS
jgi:H/ACA ribonucleoprotein complex subunit 3